MSLLAICCVTVGTVGLMQLAWVALKPLPEETGERGGERMEDLRALHAQHFPQLRQALANLDDDYLRRKASGEIERHTQVERKRIVLSVRMEACMAWEARPASERSPSLGDRSIDGNRPR